MPLKYSRRSKQDLNEIALYTLGRWGPTQLKRYLDGLESACLLLAESPQLGRDCNTLASGLRRFEHASHVIFYMAQAKHVLIVRILHKRMLPSSADFG